MFKSLRLKLLLTIVAVAGSVFILTGCKEKKAASCCGDDPSKCCGKAAVEKAASEHPTGEHPTGEHPK